jgi:anti-anti-sigma factor
VILDLTDVSFIDSYGIYILVGVSNRLAAEGQWLTLVVPEGSPVLGTFQISNVKSVLQVVPSVDEALASLDSRRRSRQAGGL